MATDSSPTRNHSVTEPSLLDENALYPPPSYEEVVSDASSRPQVPAVDNVSTPGLPPAYEYQTSNHLSTVSQTTSEVIPNRIQQQGRFLSVDFFPSCTKLGFKLRNIAPEFGPFCTLIQQANYWLQQFPNYRLLTAESIQCACEFTGEILYNDSLQFDSAYGYRLYVRGLRLWLFEDNERRGIQQISYINVSPRFVRREVSSFTLDFLGGSISIMSTNSTNPVFEKLSETLSKFNEYLKQSPLPGIVFSTELLQLHLPGRHESDQFDPDCSYWSEIATERSIFLNFIRIFYFPGGGTTSEIGLKIFAPIITNEGRKLEYENFPKVVNRAFDWIEENPDKIITNIKVAISLEHFYSRPPVGISGFFPMDDPKIDTDKVLNIASSNRRETVHYIYWDRIRSMCVTYIPRDQIQIQSSASIPPVLHNLSYKEFFPCKITKTTYESVRETLFRMTEWLSVAKAQAIHIETITIFHTPKYKKVYSDVSSNLVTFGRGIYKLLIYRVYFVGPVQEPKPEELTPIPVIQKPQQSNICSLM